MKDRLGELLNQKDVLFGMICQDATLTDIELMAQAGYHVVWLDLEHSPQSTAEALRLCRSILHLGMVPLVRVLELSRTHVQRLVDGGAQIISLPDVKGSEQARHLVQLGKYPPIGERGLSSSSAATDFSLGQDPRQTIAEANRATHLMVIIESDEGYRQLDEILEVDGIDLLTTGGVDWGLSLGLFGDEAKSQLAKKIERVVKTTVAAGKIATMRVANADQARHYLDLGVRILFLGPDVTIKRRVLMETMESFRNTLGIS